MGIYDMANGFELKKKTSFNHDSFSLTKKAKNIGVFQFSPNLQLILYFEGLSEAATKVRKSKESNFFPLMDPSLYYGIVIKDWKQVQEISIPLSFDPMSEILPLPGNRILFRDRYTGDVEPEFHTYSMYTMKAGEQ